MHRCKTCGTPLDEVPFDDCPEHKAYMESLPAIDPDEWDHAMENELLEIIYGRTGDD